MTTPSEEKIDWAKGGGLVPAIVQHADTQQVLMLGYMNDAALAATRASGKVTFFSRSKGRLWTKGETSGNSFVFVDATVDCDGDALLVRARPTGPACHRGTTSCFGDSGATGPGFLAQLDNVVAARLANPDPESSYTARLAARGKSRVAQKVGEEGLELALAGAGGSDAEVVAEGADLLYHLALLLQERGLSLAALVVELERRHDERLRQAEAAAPAGVT
jgi:phosphoribosyl-ATP pyrophosphohydrolase/phosphoribosyl-AMP cyclohydrolase